MENKWWVENEEENEIYYNSKEGFVILKKEEDKYVVSDERNNEKHKFIFKNPLNAVKLAEHIMEINDFPVRLENDDSAYYMLGEDGKIFIKK